MPCERGNDLQALVAIMVDQYLCRNKFYQTRVTFCNEVLPLFSNLPPNENLMNLEEILNQYILMKKQNIWLEAEKVMLMQEKNRIQMLLQDIQKGMDNFHARSPMSNVTTVVTNPAIIPLVENSIQNPPVVSSTTVFPVQNTMSLPPPKTMFHTHFSSPMIKVSDMKRKDTPTVDGCAISKKPRGRPPGKKKQVQCTNMLLPSPNNIVDSGSSSASTESLVVKSAQRELQISSNSVSRTHPTIHSFQRDTYVSLPPTHISHDATCNKEVVSPSYNVISTKRDMVEPVKQMVCKEGNSSFSPIVADNDETHKENTSKESNKDIDKTSTRVLDTNSSHKLENLDNSFSKENPTSESKNLDNSFSKENPTSESNKGIVDWSQIDCSNMEWDNWSNSDFFNLE
ncbi:hypothetical protein DEO72_LG11g3353 [Vigna unguiculata]|uniref:LisH domain-containing protein n=2 Tax=Vigna unguiculata TaxID=3917 RepID=A0A4D6NUY3_VIGUN|nr:hypothetical protein DEO72_LG11g3353 [Vigna unguiculata]